MTMKNAHKRRYGLRTEGPSIVFSGCVRYATMRCFCIWLNMRKKTCDMRNYAQYVKCSDRIIA
jgi:hypothetical protein